MTDDERVAPATIEDLDAVLECWVALVEHGRQHGLHLQAEPNRSVARETLAAAIADDLAFVARAGSDPGEPIAGFCTLGMDTGGFERDDVRGVVENLYVVPAARGNGVGSALLDAGEQRLIERGATTIAVETMVADEDVLSFYADRGYRPHRLTAEKRVETNR